MTDSDFFDEAIAAGPHETFRLRRQQGAEVWQEFGSTFAPLARSHNLATIYHSDRQWQGRPAVGFDDSEIAEP
ncbi:MAG TPA: hypothetical protein VHB99_10165, partial [Pirellulales bacterium]|nr:hypothetical protein [Pirellulales bacterium]